MQPILAGWPSQIKGVRLVYKEISGRAGVYVCKLGSENKSMFYGRRFHGTVVRMCGSRPACRCRTMTLKHQTQGHSGTLSPPVRLASFQPQLGRSTSSGQWPVVRHHGQGLLHSECTVFWPAGSSDWLVLLQPIRASSKCGSWMLSVHYWNR